MNDIHANVTRQRVITNLVRKQLGLLDENGAILLAAKRAVEMNNISELKRTGKTTQVVLSAVVASLADNAPHAVAFMADSGGQAGWMAHMYVEFMSKLGFRACEANNQADIGIRDPDGFVAYGKQIDYRTAEQQMDLLLKIGWSVWGDRKE